MLLPTVLVFQLGQILVTKPYLCPTVTQPIEVTARNIRLGVDPPYTFLRQAPTVWTQNHGYAWNQNYPYDFFDQDAVWAIETSTGMPQSKTFRVSVSGTGLYISSGTSSQPCITTPWTRVAPPAVAADFWAKKVSITTHWTSSITSDLHICAIATSNRDSIPAMYHIVRRSNGTWRAAQKLRPFPNANVVAIGCGAFPVKNGGTPTGSQGISAYVVTDDGRLWHAKFQASTSSWSPFSQIVGPTFAVDVDATCSDWGTSFVVATQAGGMFTATHAPDAQGGMMSPFVDLRVEAGNVGAAKKVAISYIAHNDSFIDNKFAFAGSFDGSGGATLPNVFYTEEIPRTSPPAFLGWQNIQIASGAGAPTADFGYDEISVNGVGTFECTPPP